MDDADRATDYQQRMIEHGIERARRERCEIAEGAVVCIDCGRPIPVARLSVVPWATRCVMCEARADVGSNR